MRNVKLTEKDGVLTVVIDLKQELGLSKSEKTMLIATTGGNVTIGDDGVKIGINCYKPKA